MTSDITIEIRLSGKDMIPGSVHSREIAEVITAMEDMLTSIVLKKYPQLSKETLVLGLSKIRNQSIGLVFVPNNPELLIPATIEVANSVSTNNYTSLPSKALAALEVLTGFTRKYDCLADFSTRNGKLEHLATITPDTDIPRREMLSGETVIYGDIMRVGGATPKIQFKPLHGPLIYCTADRLIVKQAGEYLYSQVGLRGDAQWDAETLEVSELRVREILSYSDTPAIQAFEQLSELIGESFNDIDDVPVFAKELRYGVSGA